MIFLLKLSFLLFRPGDELLVFLALGMEGLVAECFADRPPVFQKLLCCLAEVSCPEPLPDIFHSLFARVQHVFLVEAVVTKFIVHDLVSRKIAHHSGILLHQLIGCQQERSLRKLTPVIAVFRIADRTYRDDYLQSAFTATGCCGLRFQQIDSLLQIAKHIRPRSVPALRRGAAGASGSCPLSRPSPSGYTHGWYPA